MRNGLPGIAGFLAPLGLAMGGFLLGLAVEKTLRVLLREAAKRTGWAGGEMLLRSGRGLLVVWFTLAGIHGALLSRPLRPEITGLLDRVILAAAIAAATVVSARVAAGFVRLYAGRGEGFFGSTTIFVHLAQIAAYILGGLILLQSLGVSIAPILTALGVGGLAVALALQDTLSNLFSGLYISVSRQIRPGDYIRLDTGQEGHVTDITWRATTIEALQGNRIIVPNVKMAAAVVTNFSLPRKDLAVTLSVRIRHDCDLERLEEITLRAAEEVVAAEGGALPAQPLVRYSRFTPFGVELVVVLRAREFADQFLLRHRLIKRLHARYREAGVESAIFTIAPALSGRVKPDAQAPGPPPG